MRSWRGLLLLSGLAACHFSVDAVDLGSGAPRDLSGSGNHDMGARDLAGAGDLGCSVAGCMFGCVESPTPHCRGLAPSGVVISADYMASGLTAQTPTGDVTIDTVTGAISGGITRPAGSGVINGIGFRVATQVNGPSVGVFGVAGLTLTSGQKLGFTGGNAFALASSANVTVAGTIDGSCSAGVVGPGGSGGGTVAVGGGMGSGLGGGSGGASVPGGGSGGGGAGFGDIGGTGAAGNNTGTSAGGVIWPNISGSGTLILVGGAGGGAGGGLGGGAGGGGGGAIQISVNGTLMVSGTIDVSGCGGAHPTLVGGNGGGGGGAGGAIVLEAAQLSLTATSVISSNGGGGGGGGDNSSTDGGDGLPGSAPATGGMAGGGAGGAGGEGGSRGAQAGLRNTEGQNAPVKGGIKFGGGGGGGAGRILFRGLMVSAQAKTISPDFGDFNANNQKLTITQTATFQ